MQYDVWKCEKYFEVTTSRVTHTFVHCRLDVQTERSLRWPWTRQPLSCSLLARPTMHKDISTVTQYITMATQYVSMATQDISMVTLDVNMVTCHARHASQNGNCFYSSRSMLIDKLHIRRTEQGERRRKIKLAECTQDMVGYRTNMMKTTSCDNDISQHLIIPKPDRHSNSQ